MSGTFPLLPLRSSHCPGKVPLRNDQRGPPACSSWGWGWQPLSRAWLPKCCADSSKTCRVDEYLLPIQLNFHEDDTRLLPSFHSSFREGVPEPKRHLQKPHHSKEYAFFFYQHLFP